MIQSECTSYKFNWETQEDIAQSGQGTTKRALSKEDGKTVAVVKLLNRQSDMERRARMYREAAVLSTIDHPSIPSLLESNTENWKDLEFKLYIAIQFIPGLTLSKFNLSAISFEDKLNMVISLCETTAFCHSKGIIHRDIKPDNILLKDGNPNSPVLIDFGMSFNYLDSDDDHLTPDGQHLGNRFLILPEHKIGEIAKRDYRSDTSFLVGILFFTLTGIIPVGIDEQGRKPHQRVVALNIIDQLPQHQRDIVKNIFDVGFSHHIDKRWQTVISLIEQLKSIRNAKQPNPEKDEDFVEKIKRLQKRVDYNERKTNLALLNKVDFYAREAMKELINDLGEDWGWSSSGGVKKSEMEYRHKFFPTNLIDKSLDPKTIIHAYITGNELVIRLLEADQNLEVLRNPQSAIQWEMFKTRLQKHFLKEIANKG